MQGGFVQAQSEWKLGTGLSGFRGDGENTFWSTANRHGLPSEDAVLIGELFSEGATSLGGNWNLSGGVSAFYSTDGIATDRLALDQAFVQLAVGSWQLAVGSKRRAERYSGLSSSNGDVLWSNNARPLPGIELHTQYPIPITPKISAEGAIGHYYFLDDRVVNNAMLHYKEATLHIGIGRGGQLHLGLMHYAQWGGESEERGPQPSGFGDFLRVFVGTEGGENALEMDRKNGLGNHLGSYLLGYTREFSKGQLDFYHQTLFEDSSGQEGKTFPDGLWGLSWQLSDTSFIKAILYEYTQTTWQSGRFRRLGRDEYFNNGTYQSGWTYHGRTLGTPFMQARESIPGVDNLITAHHIGARAASGPWDFQFKSSFVKNYSMEGVRLTEPEDVVYSWLSTSLRANTHTRVHVGVGYDHSQVREDLWTVEAGIRYAISK